MSFNQYYEDEMIFLRDMGAAFAHAYPRLAPFLGGAGNDPDVERLLEGFAFLSGRLRQKLDDEFPELTHAFIALLWPHFLRPVPAMSILQFQPIPYMVTEKKSIPRGVAVDSTPVQDFSAVAEGTSRLRRAAASGVTCHFRTCYDVEIQPLALERVEVHKAGTTSSLKLAFRTYAEASLEGLQLNTLRLYLHGESFVAQSLYLWLCHYVEQITVQPAGRPRPGQSFTLPPTAMRPVGFAPEEGLFPYPPNAFVGYRLLQEYFALPQKFLFVDITGLAAVARFEGSDSFEITWTFSRPFDDHIRLTTDNIALYCTPIVNLFPREADPIRLDHTKVQYHVRPSAYNPEHFELYAIDSVMGWVQGRGERRVYHPFLALDHHGMASDSQSVYYRTRTVPAVIGEGTDTYISFVSPLDTQAFPDVETISLSLTCTNRHVPEQLKVGDISVPTGTSPEFARFRNLLQVTPSLTPPLDKGLHWQLVSNMALNYRSLAEVAALRRIISTYNFQAYVDLQVAREHALRMEGLRDVRCNPMDRYVKGAPIRGIRIDMDMQSSKFTGEGDLYLFATVLHEFMALYVTINAFCQLVVRNIDRGETYTWPVKIGQQTLL